MMETRLAVLRERFGSDIYGIPEEAAAEVISLPVEEVRRLKDAGIIRHLVWGSGTVLYSLVSLAEFLELPPTLRALQTVEVLAARGRGQQAATLGAWRKAVFERDGYRCQDCGNSDKRVLQAHHVQPIAHTPNLKFSIPNGKTLCANCHMIAHAELGVIRKKRRARRKRR